MNILKKIEEKLSDEDKKFYKEIFSPVTVARPDVDSFKDLCFLKDGTIRHYGSILPISSNAETIQQKLDALEPTYIESKDGGLSFKKHFVKSKENLNCSTYIESMDLYCKAKNIDGKFTFLAGKSPDEKPTFKSVIANECCYMYRFICKLSNKNRIYICGQITEQKELIHIIPVFYYSDDCGYTWSRVLLKTAPLFEINGRHKGLRWQNFSAEPTVVELSNSVLMLFARTSTDFLYKYYSYDGGESFTEPIKTEFHAVLTMPTLYRLSDSRILLCWSNSMPLAETDHQEEAVKNNQAIQNGYWEDVFTNRDIIMVAISDDDGKTFKGFREIGLTDIRNNVDFRSIGGIGETQDKSCHQSQVMELPLNKVMVSYGQHGLVRKIVIFDIDWLYVTERKNDLKNGLKDLSTQMYLKSVMGCYTGFGGHCAYNRTNGAVLVPDNIYEETLKIARIKDDRLVSELQGIVWNYPSNKNGKITIKYKILGDGVRFGLSDFWLNPSDPYAFERCNVSFLLKEKSENYNFAKIVFDTENKNAKLYINDILKEEKHFVSDAPNGFCYLHIQIASENEDRDGTLIKYFSAEKQD